jgi:hypothetical protein
MYGYPNNSACPPSYNQRQPPLDLFFSSRHNAPAPSPTLARPNLVNW